MSLRGDGFLAIWNDIATEGRANFYEWHNREHIPERVGTPGFLRGRRYIALEGEPEFFTLYEVADATVLSSEGYFERLNAPTEWTTRSVADFRNTARSLCRIDTSLGAGSGGFIGTLRFDCDPDRDAALLDRMTTTILPELVASPCIVAAHVGRADLAASKTKTAEQKGRPENAVPRWVVMIEGADADAVRGALSIRAGPSSLGEKSVSADARGVYQVQFDLLSPLAQAPTA